MIMTEYSRLHDFDFWGGAVNRASLLTYDELDIIESNLEEIYPDGMSKTLINDIFWFDFDWVAEMLGYKDEEDLRSERDE